MAKFTVGQRVRFVGIHNSREELIGLTATVHSFDLSGLVCSPEHNIAIVFDDRRPTPLGKVVWASQENALEPLTPPAIDEWAKEQVKKWTKPEPALPLVEKSPARLVSDPAKRAA